MSQSEWLADIGAAADELGYGVEAVAAEQVRLVALYDTHTAVVVESVLLSGDHMRRVLRPVSRPRLDLDSAEPGGSASGGARRAEPEAPDPTTGVNTRVASRYLVTFGPAAGPPARRRADPFAPVHPPPQREEEPRT